MSAQHTPGPFKVVIGNYYYKVCTVTAGTGEPVAEKIRRAYDAYLFAAAPDLLEFARMVSKLGVGDVPPYQLAEQLVAKAEGAQ